MGVVCKRLADEDIPHLSFLNGALVERSSSSGRMRLVRITTCRCRWPKKSSVNRRRATTSQMVFHYAAGIPEMVRVLVNHLYEEQKRLFSSRNLSTRGSGERTAWSADT